MKQKGKMTSKKLNKKAIIIELLYPASFGMQVVVSSWILLQLNAPILIWVYFMVYTAMFAIAYIDRIIYMFTQIRGFLNEK